MKRVVKWLVGGGFVATLVGAGVVLYWIDHIAGVALARGATYALGVETRVDSVDIGVMSGEVTLSQLRVSNPEGFSESDFLSLADGRVSVSLGSLMEDEVTLPELRLTGLHMSLEKRKGRANYEAILDGLKRFESNESSGSVDPSEEEAGKRFVVRKVIVEDVRVDVELLPLRGPLTRLPVTIERIELSDIGSDTEGGVVLAELSGTLVKAILQAILQQAGSVLPAEIAGELGAGLEALGGLAVGSVKVVGDVTVLVAGEAVKVAEFGAKVVKGVGEGGVEVLKTVGEGGVEVLKTVGEGGKQLGEGLLGGLQKTGEGVGNVGKELGKGLGGLFKPKEKKKTKSNVEDKADKGS